MNYESGQEFLIERICDLEKCNCTDTVVVDGCEHDK